VRKIEHAGAEARDQIAGRIELQNRWQGGTGAAVVHERRRSRWGVGIRAASVRHPDGLPVIVDRDTVQRPG